MTVLRSGHRRTRHRRPLLLVAGADVGEVKTLEDHPDLTSEDIEACLTYAVAKVDPSFVATLCLLAINARTSASETRKQSDLSVSTKSAMFSLCGRRVRLHLVAVQKSRSHRLENVSR
jgi:hypothetical protein